MPWLLDCYIVLTIEETVLQVQLITTRKSFSALSKRERESLTDPSAAFAISVNAPVEMLKYGDIDYLTLDYLAEVTL